MVVWFLNNECLGSGCWGRWGFPKKIWHGNPGYVWGACSRRIFSIEGYLLISSKKYVFNSIQFEQSRSSKIIVLLVRQLMYMKCWKTVQSSGQIKNPKKSKLHSPNIQKSLTDGSSRSLQQYPRTPGPNGYGWTLDKEGLKIQWMLQKPAPDDILELISCSCKKSCKTNACVCKLLHGVECSDLCTRPWTSPVNSSGVTGETI